MRRRHTLARSPQEVSSPMLPHKLHVLLVDDDEDDYLITRDLFEDSAHLDVELQWIDQVEPALAEIRQQRHDLYLLDYHMGPHNGLDVLREALRAGCRAPFIMLTGQGGRQVDLEAMRMGAYDFLVKGELTSALLERSIRYALQHARSTEALRSTVKLSSSLLTALNRVDQGVFVIDPAQLHMPMIFLNESFLSTVGYSRDELLGRGWSWLRGELTDPTLADQIQAAMILGEPFEGTLRQHRKDGEPFWHHVQLHPVRNDHGTLIQLVGISREVSSP